MNTTDMIKFNVHIDWPADVQVGIFPSPAATIYILKENEIKKIIQNTWISQIFRLGC